MATQRRKPWFKDGLKFECTQCGQCCTGAPGLVQFTPAEGREMARELGLSEQQFLERFAFESADDGLWELGDVHTEHGFDCLLLGRCEETGKTWCRAHNARPMQCRTWPFWPDNLVSEKSWKKAGRNCEGIGRGQRIPLRVIQRECERTPEWGRTQD